MSAKEIKAPPPQRFSKRWYWARARTAAWVGMVTLLVWVYADIQVTDERTFRATLQIRVAAASDRVLLSGDEVVVEFTAKARRHALDAFADDLGAGEVLVYYATELPPGEYSRSIRDLLNSLSRISDAGLEVISTSPGLVAIRLDSLQLVKDVPVEFRHNGAELAGPAKLDPDRVDIRAPAQQLQKLGPDKLRLTTAPLDLRSEPAGEELTRQVSVLPPPGMVGVQLEPKKVSVTFKILQQTAVKTFRVAVQVQQPSHWIEKGIWSQYELVVQDPLQWNQEIRVQGNRKDLEKLRTENIRAYIELKDDDLKPVGWWPGEVHVHFPPDLKVHLAESVPKFNYKLVKRSEAPGGV